MGLCIEADGARGSRTEKDMKYGLMDQSTLASMWMVKKMDLVSTRGQTRHSIMVSGVKAISMGLVSTYGVMEEATVGSGNMVRCMGMGNTPGLIIETTKVNT